MSDDLVTQLRTYFGSPLLPVSHQAADEIERLRAENARLREALEKIVYLEQPQVRGLPRRVGLSEIARAALAETGEK